MLILSGTTGIIMKVIKIQVTVCNILMCFSTFMHSLKPLIASTAIYHPDSC